MASAVNMNPDDSANGGDITALKKSMDDMYKGYMEKKEEYEKMCKAVGQEPTLPAPSAIQKSFDPDALGVVIKNEMETLAKSLNVKTTALGQILTANEEARSKSVAEVHDKLEKSQSIISDLKDFNDKLNARLNIVENTPIRKSVTAENYKERFPEKVNAGGKSYSISDPIQKANLIGVINSNFGDMSNIENVKLLEAAAQVEMAGTMTPESQALLKSKGIQVVA
jgi:hypothetical protein